LPKGALIGQGRTAEAYEWEHDKILKLFLDYVPQGWVDYEERIGRAVFASGVPAPALYEQVELEGRRGLIYQRAPGRSLLQIVQRNPLMGLDTGRVMARLQYQIHLSTSEQLPTFKGRSMEAIQEVATTLGGRTEIILEYIDRLPEVNNVCHGDFHADNILSDPSGQMVIDWMNAYRGDPMSDVARSYLMLISPYLPPGIPGLMKVVMKMFRKGLIRDYLKAYFRLAHTDFRSLERWLLPVAAARLRERVPGEEEWLLNLIDRLISKLGLTKRLEENDA
jgi:hypothetical protein